MEKWIARTVIAEKGFRSHMLAGTCFAKLKQNHQTKPGGSPGQVEGLPMDGLSRKSNSTVIFRGLIKDGEGIFLILARHRG